MNEVPEVLNPAICPPEHPETKQPDLTGRHRVAWNVATSWASYGVFIIGGFLMPRLIDRSIGQTALGIWDFGWSLVSYLGLAQLGVGSSVNRYVARYRAAGDHRATSAMVSSVVAIQCIVATIVLACTAVLSWYAPSLVNPGLSTQRSEIRTVVLCLGAALAIQMWFNPYVGVMTGCHRWDLHNFLNAGSYATSVGLGILALLAGWGLRGLAVTYLVTTVLTELVRAVLARRVCPELRVALRLAEWHHARAALLYGLKTVLNSLGRVLMYQTNSILVAAYLGPASVAVFSRPKALVLHAQTLVNKFALVLTPTASSMQATGALAELRSFLVNTTRFAAYLALPMVLFLAIMADPILELWMGAHYRCGMLLAVLAAAHLFEMVRQPAVNILAGMNRHGRVAVMNIVAAAVSVILGYVMLAVLGWGLVGAVLAISIPVALVNSIFIPAYTCRQLGIPVRHFVWSTSIGPVLCNLPFAGLLVAARTLLAGQPLLAALAGAVGGGLMLSMIYWRWVLPAHWREKVWMAFAQLGYKVRRCWAGWVEPVRLRT